MEWSGRNERFAILLKSLGDDFATAVLQRVSPEMATSMKSTIDGMEIEPPSEETITDVLEEFNRFMEFALANSRDLLESYSEEELEEPAESQFVSSGDPFHDLEFLQDYQLAGALRNETGSTVAVVLSQLSDTRTASILGLLPENIRQDAFLRLQKSTQIPRPLLQNIVQSIVARASHLDRSAASDPDHVADEKTANLLRAMDRSTRTEMLTLIEKENPEEAERIKGMLFVFEDLRKFTDKSIQKLLSEVETSVLATVLKNADDELVDRVMSNLSKRAKASLLEEIEFLESVPAEQEAEAQKMICAIFAQLDEAGDLEMVE